MMALTVDYATKTIHQLPNFFATRVTTSFRDEPEIYERPKMEWFPFYRPLPVTRQSPLRSVGQYSTTVLYRKGREEVHSSAAQSKSGGPQGFTTSGEFGPILGTAMLDAAQSTLIWSHWEQGAAGPEAVYRYAIPAEKSHYEVEYGCTRGLAPQIPGPHVPQFSAYQGEITVDPANGTILRLVLRAYPKPTDPFVDADIVVEYGPVEIGGKTYICPVRSVALSLAENCELPGSSPALLQTLLNDVVFQEYHLFRSHTRVLTGNP